MGGHPEVVAKRNQRLVILRGVEGKASWGLMEFVGVDKAARSKMGVWKMQEWTMRHHVAGVDNAGVDLSAWYGKCGQCGRKNVSK